MYSAGMPLTVCRASGGALVAEAVVAGHQAGGAVAAQKRVALDQQGVGAAARGGRRGNDAARAAARDDHLVPRHDGSLHRLTIRLPSLRLGSRRGLSRSAQTGSGCPKGCLNEPAAPYGSSRFLAKPRCSLFSIMLVSPLRSRRLGSVRRTLRWPNGAERLHTGPQRRSLSSPPRSQAGLRISLTDSGVAY